MPEPAAWRYQKILQPIFDIPAPRRILKGGRVLTCVGDTIIENGFVELENGKIKAVGSAADLGSTEGAEVIDVSRLNAGSKIVFGATVDLADEDSGEAVSYQIVGDLEADIKQQLISVSSPFARALIGKSEGDSFEFTASNGTRRYEIVAVRYVA